jgi:hypothetical protein
MSAATKQTLMEKLMALRSSTPEAAQALHDLFMPISFRAGVSFQWYEQAAPILYFFETGLVRGYVHYDGEAHTGWVQEGGFILLVNQPFVAVELEHTEFIRDSSGWLLNLEKLQPVAHAAPVLYLMLFEILLECLQMVKIRELMMRLRSAEQQFLFMYKQDKYLPDKIPHEILASLLNVTIKYLYELKKKHRDEKSDSAT